VAATPSALPFALAAAWLALPAPRGAAAASFPDHLLVATGDGASGSLAAVELSSSF
jgi:hypothetical protein